MKQKTKYTTVYRVQSKKDGLGPYRSSYTSSELDEKLMAKTSAFVDDDHPVPQNDGISISAMYEIEAHGGNWLCGFASLAKLKSWFKGCLSALKKEGFVIVERRIPTDKVLFGREQLIFEVD